MSTAAILLQFKVELSSLGTMVEKKNTLQSPEYFQPDPIYNS